MSGQEDKLSAIKCVMSALSLKRPHVLASFSNCSCDKVVLAWMDSWTKAVVVASTDAADPIVRTILKKNCVERKRDRESESESK